MRNPSYYCVFVLLFSGFIWSQPIKVIAQPIMQVRETHTFQLKGQEVQHIKKIVKAQGDCRNSEDCDNMPRISISLDQFSNTNLFKHFREAVDLEIHILVYSSLTKLEDLEFPLLEKLYIHDLNSSGDLFLGPMPKLKHLEIYSADMHINPSHPERLEQLLLHTRTFRAPEFLQHALNLKELTYLNSYIAEVEVIKDLEKLHTLALYTPNLYKMPDLKSKDLLSFTLQFNKHLNDFEFLSNFQKLENLYLDQKELNPNLFTVFPQTLSPHLKKVTLVNLDQVQNYCSLNHYKKLNHIQISSQTLETLECDFSNIEQLSSLYIGSNQNLKCVDVFGYVQREKLEIGFLPNLKTLNFKVRNENVYELRLEEMPNLKTITGLENLPNLRLIMFHSIGSQKFPAGFDQLDSLKQLSIYNCDFIDFSNLKDNTGLEILQIYESRTMEDLPPHLNTLTNLKELCLSFLHNLKSASALDRLDHLEKMSLRHFHEDFILPDEVWWSNLKFLNLETRINNIEVITKQPALEDLTVFYAQELPKALFEHDQLRALKIFQAELESLRHFKAPKHLQKLELAYNKNLKTLPKPSQLQKIDTLKFYNNTHLEDYKKEKF